MSAQDVRPSPFLEQGPISTTGSLAILHLKRDLLLPTVLSELDEANEGYDEGRVTNTRFGSFPHSTLIGLPWGSQVRASEVDTGSRGRKGPNQNFGRNKKRKREDKLGGDDALGEGDNSGTSTPKAAVVASTGFIHLLPPTPESWTASLPHRTQVVYTPDYSYILHRLRVRPGSVLIEAGAGSGSFSHASARAVFNGYPAEIGHSYERSTIKRRKCGKVYSYEFHEQRVGKLREEIKTHGLNGIVEITHRDVCENGFLLESPARREEIGDLEENYQAARSPEADAIFLDLPAPWLALRHLTRKAMTSDDLSAAITSPKDSATSASPSTPVEPETATSSTDATAFLSPLNPSGPIRICTFSPCIEQVQRTVSTLRHLGWVDIEMVEIAHKRIEVWRERVGLHEDGVKGANASPATVEEAIERLKEVEGRFRTARPMGKSSKHIDGTENADVTTSEEANAGLERNTEIISTNLPPAPTERHARPRNSLPIFRQGRLIHRPEPELKTHTSYLVFAVLPQEWSAEDEAQARARWPVKPKEAGADTGAGIRGKKSKRQMKREAAIAAATEERDEDMDVDADTKNLQLGEDGTADEATTSI